MPITPGIPSHLVTATLVVGYLVTGGCTGADPKQDTPGQCQALCESLATTAVEVAMQGDPASDLTEALWNEHCAAAEPNAACEACFRYINEKLLDYSVSSDCGCGFTLEGMRECSQDPELAEDVADFRIESCQEQCDGFALVY